MAQMNTDAAVLAKEAGNFDRLAGEFSAVKAAVDSEANTLSSQMVGQAGTAAHMALARFDEAIQKQIQELHDISNNISTAGTHYTSTDEDQSSSLSSAMNI